MGPGITIDLTELEALAAELDALKPKVDEQRAQMTKLRTAHEENIAKSFTADQKAAWTKIKEEREARMKERAQQQQH